MLIWCLSSPEHLFEVFQEISPARFSGVMPLGAVVVMRVPHRDSASHPLPGTSSRTAPSWKTPKRGDFCINYHRESRDGPVQVFTTQICAEWEKAVMGKATPVSCWMLHFFLSLYIYNLTINQFKGGLKNQRGKKQHFMSFKKTKPLWASSHIYSEPGALGSGFYVKDSIVYGIVQHGQRC